MSQDETLRLAAEIVDKWSGPLRNMQRDLRTVGDQLKGTHATATTYAKKHEEAVSDLGKAIGKIDEQIKSSLRPSLAALGITTLTVVDAIAAMKNTVVGFAGATRELTFLSRETDVAIDRLRQFDALARRIGTTPDAMNRGISEFAKHMLNLRRMVPDELNALHNNADKRGIDYALKMSRMNNADALNAAIGFLDNIPKQEDKRKWLGLFGLPQEFANLPVAELRKALQEIRKSIGTLGPDAQKNALAFQDAMDRLGDSMDRLKLDVGADLANSFSHATDAIREFIDENRSGLVGAARETASAIIAVVKAVRELAVEFQHLRGGDYSDVMPHLVPGGPADRLRKFLGEPFSIESLKRLFGHPSAPDAPSGWSGLSNIVRGMPATPMSFRGAGFGGAYLMNASYASGTRDAEELLARGVKTGMIEAMREFAGFGTGSDFGVSGGNSGGMRRVSFGGGAGLGGGASSSPMGLSIPSGVFGNDYIAARRAMFADELKDPQKRLQFAAMLATEGERDPVPVAESAMNRSDYAHKTLTQMLHSGFYGPINRGQLPGMMRALQRDPARLARLNRAIDAALGGSDIIHGATDQGMPSDPNGRWPGGRTMRGGNVFNDWGGGPGGHEGARRWREQFEARGGLMPHFTVEDISRAIGGTSRNGEGRASLDITINGLPRASRSSIRHNGVFKGVRLNPGRTMVPAGQDD